MQYHYYSSFSSQTCGKHDSALVSV